MIKLGQAWNNAVYSNEWFVPSMKRIQFTFKAIMPSLDTAGHIGIGVVSEKHHLSKKTSPHCKESIIYYNGGYVALNGTKHGPDSKVKYTNEHKISFIIDFISDVVRVKNHTKSTEAVILKLKDLKYQKLKLCITIYFKNDGFELLDYINDE